VSADVFPATDQNIQSNRDARRRSARELQSDKLDLHIIPYWQSGKLLVDLSR